MHQGVKGCIEVLVEGMPIAGFEMAEAVKGASQRAGDIDALLIGEVVGQQRSRQDVDDSLNGNFEFGIASAGVAVRGGVGPRVVFDQLAPRRGNGRNRVVASEAGGSIGQPRRQQLSALQPQRSNEFGVAADVSVERRLARPQLASHTTE